MNDIYKRTVVSVEVTKTKMTDALNELEKECHILVDRISQCKRIIPTLKTEEEVVEFAETFELEQDLKHIKI